MSFGFDGRFGTDARPAHKPSSKLWAKDPTTPGSDDGTRLTASLINMIVANLREVANRNGVTLADGLDTILADAIDAAAAAVLDSPSLTGTPTAPTPDYAANDARIATTAFVVAALAGKQGLDENLTAIAALTTTAYGRSLLELADDDALTEEALAGDLDPGFVGAAPMVLGSWIRSRPWLSLDEVGAVGDGSADDTERIQDAIDTGRDIYVPAGNYRTTDTLKMDRVGQRLVGKYGANDSKIYADHVLGPALLVTKRQCGIEDLYIDASSTRNAAAVGSGNHGIQLGDATTTSLTSTVVRRCVLIRQPCDGLYMATAGFMTLVEQVQALYNRGHGFVFDDGTHGGYNLTRNGIVRVTNCRALGSGGNAVALAPEGGNSCYRFQIDNLEADGAAWNTAIAGLKDAVIYVLGQQVEISHCGLGDSVYAETTQPNGDSRLAKANPAAGIRCGGNTNGLSVIGPRFINARYSMVLADGCDDVRVEQPFVEGTQAIGYDIGAGCSNVRISLPSDTGMTVPVDSETDGTVVWIAGVEHRTVAGASSLFACGDVSATTIVGGAINAQSEIVVLTGEGDTTDTLVSIYFAGAGVPLPDGFRLQLINDKAYTITVSGTLGNIRTQTGVNVSLAQDRAMSLVAYNGLLYHVG